MAPLKAGGLAVSGAFEAVSGLQAPFTVITRRTVRSPTPQGRMLAEASRVAPVLFRSRGLTSTSGPQVNSKRGLIPTPFSGAIRVTTR